MNCKECGNEITNKRARLYCSDECGRRFLAREWRRANPEKHRAWTAAWEKTNPEKKRASDRKWRQAHSEYCKAYHKNWREQNPEYHKNWREQNPEYHKNWRAKRSAEAKAQTVIVEICDED